MITFNPSSLASQFANFFGAKQGQGVTQGTQVSLRSQTQTGISILTAEGDKVTLSTNQAFKGTGILFNYRGVLEGQPISLRANALEGQSKTFQRLRVEGDLNEQEIQDIQKVIASTRGLVDDLAKGDINTAFARGQQISASGSLAAVGVKIQYSESLSIRQSVQSVTTNGGSPTQGSPVIGSSEEGTASLVSQANTSKALTLRGILENIFEILGFISNKEPQAQAAGDGEPSASLGNLLDKVKRSFDEQVESLKGFLGKVKDRLTEDAAKIAKLATKLEDRVAQQAGKIAKAFAKLASLASQGITSGDKVDTLNEQIATRSEQLANEVSDYQSKIDEKVEALDTYIDSSGEAILQKANNLEGFIDRYQERINDELHGGTNAGADELFDEFTQITSEGGLIETLRDEYGQEEEEVSDDDEEVPQN